MSTWTFTERQTVCKGYFFEFHINVISFMIRLIKETCLTPFLSCRVNLRDIKVIFKFSCTGSLNQILGYSNREARAFGEANCCSDHCSSDCEQPSFKMILLNVFFAVSDNIQNQSQRGN